MTEIRLRVWSLIAVVSAGALVSAYAWGRSSAPAKVEVRTEFKDRVVYRDRDVEKKVQGPVRVRTVTREIPGPQGPERVVERVVERGPVVTEKKHEAQGEEAHEAKTLTLKVTEQPRWQIGATAAVNPLHGGDVAYGGFLNYRIGGPFWLGVNATSAGSVGGSLGVSF